MSDGARVGFTPESSRDRRLALVLWNGDLGGAEILNAALAEHLRQQGVTVTIVFIGSPQPLAERLRHTEISYCSLNLRRGRDVLRHPRLYAEQVSRYGPDGALLVERGFMGAALYGGGYRGPIISVEHGALLLEQDLPTLQRMVRRLSRICGAWAADAEVAVSDFMLEMMRHEPHARQIRRIYNGIDQDTYLSVKEAPADLGSELVVGFAGRLVPGKGADRLIQALARVATKIPAKLLIAGDGPERPRLASLARALNHECAVEFLGVVDDLPAFWRQCDIAAVPSDDFIESFSMVTLEAMACGKPIVATRNGAIPELIVDGVTGTLVPPGDVEAFAQSLVAYAEQPELRRAHGASARRRAVEQFSIDACARAYLDLFGELTQASMPGRSEGHKTKVRPCSLIRKRP